MLGRKGFMIHSASLILETKKGKSLNYTLPLFYKEQWTLCSERLVCHYQNFISSRCLMYLKSVRKKNDKFHLNVLYNKSFDIQPDLLRDFRFTYFSWRSLIFLIIFALYNQQHISLHGNPKIDFGILPWKTVWFWVF